MASHTLTKIALLVTVWSLCPSEPLPDSDESEACVMQQVYMQTPIQQDFLVFVQPWPHFVLVFKLHGVDDALTRDGVNITNNKMVHSKVRNGQTTEHPLKMPKHIPHGWNTLRVAVAERSLDVTLVQSEDYVHLLTLALDHDVAEMYMPDAALCSKDIYSWPLGIGCFVSGVIVMGVISSVLYFLLQQRNKRRKSISDGNEAADESGIELLEKKNTSDGSEPTIATGNASHEDDRQEKPQSFNCILSDRNDVLAAST